MNLYIKLVLIQVALLTFQTVTYFLIQKFEGPPHNIELPLDRKIPLVPQTICIYALWFPLIALFPLYLHTCSAGWYLRYMVSIIADIFISAAIYLLYPTSFQRPVPPAETFFGRVMGFVYKVDYKGKNCMPSMHCSMCFIIILTCLGCQTMAAGIKTALCVLSVLIVCATVLTKQHVVIDVITALPLAILCFLLGTLGSGLAV